MYVRLLLSDRMFYPLSPDFLVPRGPARHRLFQFASQIEIGVNP